jgi:hypothetical protein
MLVDLFEIVKVIISPKLLIFASSRIQKGILYMSLVGDLVFGAPVNL